MIAAAKADGEVDPEERARIVDGLRAAGARTTRSASSRRSWPSPWTSTRSPPRFATRRRRPRSTSPLWAIHVDTEAERRYLESLALRLGLDRAVVDELEKKLQAPRRAERDRSRRGRASGLTPCRTGGRLARRTAGREWGRRRRGLARWRRKSCPCPGECPEEIPGPRQTTNHLRPDRGAARRADPAGSAISAVAPLNPGPEAAPSLGRVLEAGAAVERRTTGLEGQGGSTWGKTPGMQVGIRLLVIAGPSVSAAFARPTRLQSGGSPGLLPLVRESLTS